MSVLTNIFQKRTITVTDLWRGRAIVPEIRLCGKWLKAAGFGKGQKVDIIIEGNQLIIRKRHA